ncbi:hypothetical protein SLS62_002408 [Diatrype stigma]|uniref:DUF1275 domain-containing protein n=1 Tax=Diatrype stigma TaxID=117547 RepID=A0AAN9YQS5_9PEZI
MAAPASILPTSNDTSGRVSLEGEKSQRRRPRAPALFSNMRGEIDKHHADIPVCLCSLVSGLCDSVAFNASSVFVSMQTGNTVFLALGTAGLPSSVRLLWLRALCSIAAFIAGVFLFSQATRRARPTAKGTLAASFLAQALLIWAAAGLAQGGAAPSFASLGAAEALARSGEWDPRGLAVVVLLALGFGGQIVASRQLGFNEVPTNVLTSLYCDLFSDPALLAPWGRNPKRNRRAAAALLMLAGAVAGGWLSRSRDGAGLPVALWVGGAVKLGIAVAWAAWKVKDDDHAAVQQKQQQQSVVGEKK